MSEERHSARVQVEYKDRPIHRPWKNNKPLPEPWTQVDKCNMEKRQHSSVEYNNLTNHLLRTEERIVGLMKTYPHPVVVEYLRNKEYEKNN